MEKGKVTAVFDIGKTNKKFFLFDSDFQEVYREYARFEEIEDEDGHPTENLSALQKWLQNVFNRMLETKEYKIKAINFSSYGASFVHIGYNGSPIAPLYNYTKKIDQEIIDEFYEKYGPEEEFTRATGSPKSGLLNSGMQLFWLKHRKTDIFSQIKYSLHLPQYLSYVFTGIPLSEYTSIGCHTSLWDFDQKDYHQWVYEEGLDRILPPIVSTETSVNMNYNGKRIKIGVGIHDSSAALLPYVRSSKKKFILISTGTWSISLNPFVANSLSEEDVQNDCINYMRINGRPVKASRIMLGEEYEKQVQLLTNHYGVDGNYHFKVNFNYDIYQQLINKFKPRFRWFTFSTEKMPKSTFLDFRNFDIAYHHLMIELVQLQIENIHNISGDEKIRKLYLDGGFSDNDVYIQLLSHYLRDYTLRTTDASLGSALGAAIAISDAKLNSKFLKKNYSLKKHVPFIIQ